MPTALNRISGKDVVVTLIGGVKVNFESIDIEIMGEYEIAKSCGSGVKQRVYIDKDSKITLNTWASGENNLNAIHVNDVPDDISFTTNEGGTPSLLPADFATDFPTNSWRVDTIKHTQTDKSGKVTVTMVPNDIGAS